jgi:uncharacterized protein (TIGR03000 family)
VVVYQQPAAGGRASSDVTPLSNAEREAIKELLKRLRSKPKETNNGDSARVTVQLPADANLWVNDKACPLTSAKRSFVTAALEPGRSYYYTLRAQVQRNGQLLTQTRRVDVVAGREVDVRFDFSSAQTASR